MYIVGYARNYLARSTGTIPRVLIVKDRFLITVYRYSIPILDLSVERLSRVCVYVRVSLVAGGEATCGTPLEGDADPVPERIYLEIFETSSARPPESIAARSLPSRARCKIHARRFFTSSSFFRRERSKGNQITPSDRIDDNYRNASSAAIIYIPRNSRRNSKFSILKP